MQRNEIEIRPETHLPIGKVLKPWGLKGAVSIYSYAETPESFQKISALYVEGENGTTELPIEEARRHKKGILLRFKGRDRIEDVEDLVGLTLYMNKKELPPLEEGEYYWHELIGMEVLTDTGRTVGNLERIFDIGSHDVYVVTKEGREVLIPAVREVVRKVDVAGRRMFIHPVEGLLTEDDL